MPLKISRNNLALIILLFMLVINIFLIFDLQIFYIRAILAFLFIILVPGLLIMLMFKIKTGFWEYLVYTVGLSVAFIMFAGLAVNWTLPFLGITDKPLSLYPILICFDIILLIFSFIAYKRNKDLNFEAKFPKLDTTNRIFFIIPMIFPVLSVLGAFILNNQGPNYLTMIMLGMIAVYVLLVVIFRKKLNSNVYPWALWMISLSLLLSFSLRSWYMTGGDVNKEFSMFQLVKNSGFWKSSNFENAYSAMLNISILPELLFLYAKTNSYFTLKIFYPLIFSSVPLVIYLSAKQNFKKIICFFASFFFMSQQVFFNWADLPTRQGIAFIFFGLMLLVLFTKELSSNIKKLLFIIFGFSMIVSHYSTSYIALTMFIIAYILILMYKFYENRKIKKGKLKEKDRSQFYLTGGIILLLLIFGFLWYNQVTPTANGLIGFAHKSINNLGDMFNQEFQADGKTSIDRFNIFSKPIEKSQQLKEYTDNLILNRGTNLINNTSYRYTPRIMSLQILPKKLYFEMSNKIYFISEILKRVMYLLIILGFIITIIINYKKKYLSYNYISILISGFFLFSIILFLPFISIQYSLLRAYQQFLIFLSVMAVLGGLFIVKYFKEEGIQEVLLSLVFVFFFLIVSGFIPQLIGGVDGSMRLNNIPSLEYDIYFTHSAEVYSADWLFKNYKSKVYSDIYTNTKLSSSQNKNGIYKLITDIFPQTMEKGSYTYLSYSNIFKGVVFSRYKNSFLFYNFPTQFLKDNKNKIYNNGGSEIFK